MNPLADTTIHERHGLGPYNSQRYTLIADGDGLAYFCAGGDGMDPADSVAVLQGKLRSAAAAIGDASVVVATTLPGSNKGERYAIARRKPYQGQRTHADRPKNWEHLRAFVDGTRPIAAGVEVHTTTSLEADDLMGIAAHRDPEHTVILTQDKDMRMLPGYHMDWDTHIMLWVPPGTWEIKHNDKVYGTKWFFLQLLQGDTADNIPGLPKYVVDGKEKPVGPATAEKLLAGYSSVQEAAARVFGLYFSYYGDQAAVELLEQACLLWIRAKPDWFDVLRPGRPLHSLAALMTSAIHEIGGRIDEARKLQRQHNEQ